MEIYVHNDANFKKISKINSAIYAFFMGIFNEKTISKKSEKIDKLVRKVCCKILGNDEEQDLTRCFFYSNSIKNFFENNKDYIVSQIKPLDSKIEDYDIESINTKKKFKKSLKNMTDDIFYLIPYESDEHLYWGCLKKIKKSNLVLIDKKGGENKLSEDKLLKDWKSIQEKYKVIKKSDWRNFEYKSIFKILKQKKCMEDAKKITQGKDKTTAGKVNSKKRKEKDSDINEFNILKVRVKRRKLSSKEIVMKIIFSAAYFLVMCPILVKFWSAIVDYYQINIICWACILLMLILLSAVATWQFYRHTFENIKNKLNGIEEYFYINVSTPIKILISVTLFSVVGLTEVNYLIEKIPLMHILKGVISSLIAIFSLEWITQTFTDVKCSYFYKDEANKFEKNKRYIYINNLSKNPITYKLLGICRPEELKNLKRIEDFKSTLEQPSIYLDKSENCKEKVHTLKGKETSKKFTFAFLNKVPEEYNIVYFIFPNKIKSTYIRDKPEFIKNNTKNSWAEIVISIIIIIGILLSAFESIKPTQVYTEEPLESIWNSAIRHSDFPNFTIASDKPKVEDKHITFYIKISPIKNIKVDDVKVRLIGSKKWYTPTSKSRKPKNNMVCKQYSIPIGAWQEGKSQKIEVKFIVYNKNKRFRKYLKSLYIER